MQKALFIVIALGLGIGLLIPTGPSEPPQAEAAAAEVAPVGAAPKEARAPAPQTGGSWGGEARIRRRSDGHFYANAMVNGQPVEVIIDSGASSVALTVADAQRIGIAVDPSSFEVVGTGASGPVRGQRISLASVEVEGRRVSSVSGAVLEGLEQSLLGQSYLGRIGSITMNGDYLTLR